MKKTAVSADASPFWRFAFWSGILLFLLILLLPPADVFPALLQKHYPHLSPAQLQLAARNVQNIFALLALMVIWWVTEAVPLPITALLPVVIAPLLHLSSIANGTVQQIAPKTLLSAYADPIIFLFLGSFLLATMLQHRRIDRAVARWMLSFPLFARSYRSLLLGLMLTAALLSMWLSNTAVTAMLLPLVLALLQPLEAQQSHHSIAIAYLLGVAWASSIGGIATIVGTPPNGIAVALLHQHQIAEMSFIEWMQYGLPISVLLLPIGWFFLSRLLPNQPLHSEEIDLLTEPPEPFARPQKLAVAVFALTVLAWILIPLLRRMAIPGLSTALQPFSTWLIGIIGGIAACAVPVHLKQREFVLNWKTAALGVDWGTLLLFGGGLALSKLLIASGAGHIIVDLFLQSFGTLSTPVLIVTLVLLLNFLTEITSNTAITSLMVPIIIALCLDVGADAQLVVIATAIGASLAFMMPVATPPNALVFGTGKIPLTTMIRQGFRMNLLAWVFVSLIMLLWTLGS